MKIAVASPFYPSSINEAVQQAEKLIKAAARQQATIICFPESYLPGYTGMEFKPEEVSAGDLQSALNKVCNIAAENNIAVIMPMDWYEAGNLFNVAQVISNTGQLLGYQTKNQLDPSEDSRWMAGTARSVFEVKGIKFGITICHEGFRYPESVRWAAMRGAKIVFHPNCTGSNTAGNTITEWGNKNNPYYEKAQMMRAMENTIYFAASNYTFRYPESASAVISPDGNCIAYQPYEEAGVAIAEIDIDAATGLLAKRFKPALYS